MTMREFVELVRSMRAKQTEYFKTHQTDALIESKALERRVDAIVREHEDQQPELPGC